MTMFISSASHKEISRKEIEEMKDRTESLRRKLREIFIRSYNFRPVSLLNKFELTKDNGKRMYSLQRELIHSDSKHPTFREHLIDMSVNHQLTVLYSEYRDKHFTRYGNFISRYFFKPKTTEVFNEENIEDVIKKTSLANFGNKFEVIDKVVNAYNPEVNVLNNNYTLYAETLGLFSNVSLYATFSIGNDKGGVKAVVCNHKFKKFIESHDDAIRVIGETKDLERKLEQIDSDTLLISNNYYKRLVSDITFIENVINGLYYS